MKHEHAEAHAPHEKVTPPEKATAAHEKTAKPAAVKAVPHTAEGAVARLRTLAAELKSGDDVRAWDAVWEELEAVKASHKPAAAPTALGTPDPDARAKATAAAEVMTRHADRLEEICQHTEGGTNNPVAAAVKAGGASWLTTLLPILLEILQGILARQPKPTP